MDRDGATTFYHKDGLGSVTGLSDISQNQVGSYAYSAFGSVCSQTGSVNNPYLFTDRRLDIELNLYYYRARYYNPIIGRFTTKDPYPGNIYNPHTLHKYIYVGNNPVNYIDPLGLCKCDPSLCEANKAECIQNAKQEGVECLLDVGKSALPGVAGEIIATGAFGLPGFLIYGATEVAVTTWAGKQCERLVESLKASCETAYENCMSRCK